MRLFRLFRTGSVFTHPHAVTYGREGGDALPYKRPITSEKPPSFVTGRLTLSNCQREVSHCQRTQSAGKNSSVGKLICEKMEQGSSWQLPPGQSLSGMQ